MNRFAVLIFVSSLLAACGPKALQPDTVFECSNCDRWNEAQQPFRIYGNTWYVGTEGLTSLLIETSDGLILLDGGLPQSAIEIDENIRELGFDPLNISAILLSHAHFDHAGGIAALQRYTGASVYSSAAGVTVLESGELQPDDPQYVEGDTSSNFPAVANTAAVGNREVVTVGDVDVMAVHTPGHSPGGTTWSWQSCVLDTCHSIVYADSMTVVSAAGYLFSDGPAAHQIIESAGAISELDCDILLSPHPFFFGMQEKLENRASGNPFVNNLACMFYAESSLDWLEQRLTSEGQ